jgi:hypothetical protein
VQHLGIDCVSVEYIDKVAAPLGLEVPESQLHSLVVLQPDHIGAVEVVGIVGGGTGSVSRGGDL